MAIADIFKKIEDLKKELGTIVSRSGVWRFRVVN